MKTKDCVFEDLLLLNYYEGWYSGAILDESYIGDATEWYFGWLTGIANDYDIPTDYDETPDGCDALHKDIEDYLRKHIAHVDLDDVADYALTTIKDIYDYSPNHIYEMDIFTIVDHVRIIEEMMSIIYAHCVEVINKEYKVI